MQYLFLIPLVLIPVGVIYIHILTVLNITAVISMEYVDAKDETNG